MFFLPPLGFCLPGDRTTCPPLAPPLLERVGPVLGDSVACYCEYGNEFRACIQDE